MDRHVLAALGFCLVLAVAYPLLVGSGHYSGDQLATFYVLVGVALACHLADWWDGAAGEAGSARPAPRTRLLQWPPSRPGERAAGPFPFTPTDVMRGVVLFLTLTFLLLGLTELIGGLAGQAGSTSGGSRLSPSDQVAGGGLLTAAGVGSLLLQLGGSDRVPGFRRLRPDRPISWFAVLVVLLSFAQLLSPTSGTESVASTIANPTTATDLVLGSLPFGVIAVLAIGPLVARSPREAAQRLGLIPIRPLWWLIAIAVGVLLVPAVDSLFTPLQDHLLPQDCVIQQGQVQQSLAGGDSGRGGGANLAIALAAGIDEELLFRGVVLPRFGLLISSLLFGAFHLQYTCHGLPAVGDLEIVVLGLAFGLLRVAGGLPAAILAHAAYDASILLNAVLPSPSPALVLIALALVTGAVVGARRRGWMSPATGVSRGTGEVPAAVPRETEP